MNEKDIQNLILLSRNLDWTTQGTLLKAEDHFIQQKELLCIRSDETRIGRYLALGSLPFVFDDQIALWRAQEIANQIWPDEWLDLRNKNKEEYNGRLPTLPRGNLNPEYMFIGDAPGRGLSPGKFDRTMTYGPSSHILRKALLHWGKLHRSFFTNLVKVSQTNNKPTSGKDVLAWKEYLYKEIELLQPKTIVLLGDHVQEMFQKYYLHNMGLYRSEIKVVKIQHPSHISRIAQEFQVYGDAIRVAVQ